MASTNLLVISNSESNRDKLKTALKSDFNLKWCATGTEALAHLRKELPHIVVIDHTLSDFKTFELVDKVRNNPITRHLSFVVVSRESSNEFVEKGVRSGVSHYIGIPFEPKMLVQKILYALKQGQVSRSEKYFSLKTRIDTQVTSFGRISYITPKGIHFESHVKLNPEDRQQIFSPLANALQVQSIEVKIAQVTSDTFYNYPFAIDAEWTDAKLAEQITTWIEKNRKLNSPKKAKVLILTSDLDFEESASKVINQSIYSLRFGKNVAWGIENIPFMKPAGVAVSSKEWQTLKEAEQKQFLEILRTVKSGWILYGDPITGAAPSQPIPFESPSEPNSLIKAIEAHIKAEAPEPDRLYFSKTLEDSRLKLFFPAKTLELGELGACLALSKEVVPPCNFQLNLKIFSEQDLRNPYVRAWPPITKLSASDSEKGHYPISVDCHFLGINDQQGQSIRQWVINEELKATRDKIADKPPSREDSKK